MSLVVRQWVMVPPRAMRVSHVGAASSFELQAFKNQLQSATDNLNTAKGLFATGEIAPDDATRTQDYRIAAQNANQAAHLADVAVHALPGADPTRADTTKNQALLAWQANGQASTGTDRDTVRQAAADAITAADAALAAASAASSSSPSSGTSRIPFPWLPVGLGVLAIAAGVAVVWHRSQNPSPRPMRQTWLPPDLAHG